MKKYFLTFLIFILFFTNGGFAHAENENEIENKKSNYLILYKKGFDFNEIEKLNGKIRMKLKHFPIASIELNEKAAMSLKKNKNITYLEVAPKVYPAAITEGETWGQEEIQVKNSWEKGYIGNGVSVAVIDTGVSQHKDLIIAGGANCRFVEYCDENGDYSDEEEGYGKRGHGTHVAGIIAAQHNDVAKGVAPGVKLYAYKALGGTGDENENMDSVLRALEWIYLQNTDKIDDVHIDIVNMSFGTQGYSVVLDEILRTLYERGVLLVAANMNNFSDVVGYPARSPYVIAVGSKEKDGMKSDFSNTGLETELGAPGRNILSTISNATYIATPEEDLEKLHSTTGYMYKTGTSQATPFVTGAAALLKEQFPTYNNHQIRKLLHMNALFDNELMFPLGETDPRGEAWSHAFGYGIVQAKPIEIKNTHFNLWKKEMDNKERNDYYNDEVITLLNNPNYKRHVNPYSGYEIDVPSYWFIDNKKPDEYVRYFFHDFKIESTFHAETDPLKQEEYIVNEKNSINKTPVYSEGAAGLNDEFIYKKYSYNLDSFDRTGIKKMILYFIKTNKGVLTFTVNTSQENLERMLGLSIESEIEYALRSLNLNTQNAPVINPYSEAILNSRSTNNNYFSIPNEQYVFGIRDDSLTRVANLEQSFNTKFGSQTVRIFMNSDIGATTPIIDSIINSGKIPIIDLKMGPSFDHFYFDAILNESNYNHATYMEKLNKLVSYVATLETPVYINLGKGFTGNYENKSAAEGLYNADQYKLTYRKIADLFKNQGADNAKFIWMPDVTLEPNVNWNQSYFYYPGDNYVDVIGIQATHMPGIGTVTFPGGGISFGRKTLSFDELIRETYSELRLSYPRKPMMLEITSGEYEHDGISEKSRFIQEMFNKIPAEYQNISIVTYDNMTPEYNSDYKIDHYTARQKFIDNMNNGNIYMPVQ